MRLLLDTHALIWWLAGDRSLTRRALEAIDDPMSEVIVNAVSAFEVTTKFRLGKLPEAEDLAQDFEAARKRQGFSALPISMEHAVRAGSLQGVHRDPFDRLLIAQALTDNLVLVSNEKAFDNFGVLRLW